MLTCKHAAIAASLCGILAVLPVAGQLGGGSIVGYVTDPSGGAVPVVQIVAVNASTGVRSETTANEQGYYEFPLLPAGKYWLQAEAQGFQKALSAEFILNTGSRPRIDLKLVLGQVNK